MPCDPWPTYEDTIYKHLEESIFAYMDDEMITMFVPAIKKALCDELAVRRDGVAKLEAVLAELFPGEGCGVTE